MEDHNAAEAALRAAGFAVGDTIEAGVGEEYGRGRIIEATDSVRCLIAWSDGATTPCAISDMRHAEAGPLAPLVACENCEWQGQPDALQPVRDIFMRVAPGEPMPAGECPDCGALAHYLRDMPTRD